MFALLRPDAGLDVDADGVILTLSPSVPGTISHVTLARCDSIDWVFDTRVLGALLAEETGDDISSSALRLTL